MHFFKHLTDDIDHIALQDAKQRRKAARAFFHSTAQAEARGEELDNATKLTADRLEERQVASHAAQGKLLAEAIAAGASLDVHPPDRQVGQDLLAANTHYAVTANALTVLRARHGIAAAELKAADAEVLEQADRVIVKEILAKTREVNDAADALVELGAELKSRIAFDPSQPINLGRPRIPPEVERALSRMPVRDDIHTPVNQLKYPRASIGTGWTDRMRELLADEETANNSDLVTA